MPKNILGIIFIILFFCIPVLADENNIHFGIDFSPSIPVGINPYSVFWGGRIFAVKDIFFAEFKAEGASSKTREINSTDGNEKVITIHGMYEYACYVNDDRYFRTMANTRSDFSSYGLSIGLVLNRKILDDRVIYGVLKVGLVNNFENITGDLLGDHNVKLCTYNSGILISLGAEAAVEIFKIYNVIFLFNTGYEYQPPSFNTFKLGLEAMI
jgi:hypothetical protein